MDYRVIERPVRDLLGEGPHWSVRERALYWVDIKAPALNRLHLPTGEVRRWPMPEAIGWVVERRCGDGLIAGFKSGFAELRLDPLGIRPIGDPEPERPHNRLNDAKVDRFGHIWAGSKDDRDEEASGALYRLAPDRSWSRQDEGYKVTNGPTFSPDGRLLYHADSGRGEIYRFDVSAEGRLSNKRLFLRFEEGWGSPDGMTTDAEGHLWVAHWGGGRVSRFAPDGRLARAIPLPASQITSCAFAGDGLDRLFVTSAADGRETEPLAGALFEVEPGVRGLAPHLYAG